MMNLMMQHIYSNWIRSHKLISK